MIGRVSCGIGLVALIAGAAALAEPSTSNGDNALKARKDDPNRMVCRTEVEGATRLDRRRACHTVAEWAELRRQTRANIDHIQNTRPGSY